MLEEKMTSSRAGVNIEPYLRAGLKQDIIDYSLRAHIGVDNHVYFYIHPTGKDGETMDYEAFDDQLLLRY